MGSGEVMWFFSEKFLEITLEALWFYLPILGANQCPEIARRLHLPGADVPVSARLLGANKTWAAYYACPIGAIAILYAQSLLPSVNVHVGIINYRSPDLWLLGCALGLGVALGDHIKSLVKRHLGKPPGHPWWPWDQTDYVFGGCILAVPLIGWIGWEQFAIMLVAAAFVINPIGNWIGYRIGARPSAPW